MAFLTVSQLRTLVSSIPASANAFEVHVPDGAPLPVVAARTADARGSVFYTVRGYLDLGLRTWTPVP